MAEGAATALQGDEGTLTCAQRAYVVQTLRDGLGLCLRARVPLRLPTFGVWWRTVTGVAVLSLPRDETGRRGVGTYSDPTMRAALGVDVPEIAMVSVAHAEVQRHVEALPSHLYEPLWRHLVEQKAQTAVADELAWGDRTVWARVGEALEALGAALYGERWG